MTLTGSEAPDLRRRRIAFRAWHRGTREMDLILGRFADAELSRFDSLALDALEALMEQSDPDLYRWISGEDVSPAGVDGALIARIRAFHTRTGGHHG